MAMDIVSCQLCVKKGGTSVSDFISVNVGGKSVVACATILDNKGKTFLRYANCAEIKAGNTVYFECCYVNFCKMFSRQK